MRGKAAIVVAMGVSLALGSVAISSQGANALLSATTQPAEGPTPAGSPANCSYPPVRTPTLYLTSSTSTAEAGEPFTLSGNLKINACPISGASIGLYRSPNKTGPFNRIAETVTDGSGNYSFPASQNATRSYQTVSGSTSKFNSTVSSIVTVKKVS